MPMISRFNNEIPFLLMDTACYVAQFFLKLTRLANLIISHMDLSRITHDDEADFEVSVVLPV